MRSKKAVVGNKTTKDCGRAGQRLLPSARRIDADVVRMGGEEGLHKIKPPLWADLGPLENPRTLRRKADSVLQKTEEADEAIPAIRLILHTHSDLVIARRLILDGWEHCRTRKPDDKAASWRMRLKHCVPHVLLFPKSKRANGNHVNRTRADRRAPKRTVFAHLHMQ